VLSHPLLENLAAGGALVFVNGHAALLGPDGGRQHKTAAALPQTAAMNRRAECDRKPQSTIMLWGT
jgi:hypothetical protein